MGLVLPSEGLQLRHCWHPGLDCSGTEVGDGLSSPLQKVSAHKTPGAPAPHSHSGAPNNVCQPANGGGASGEGGVSWQLAENNALQEIYLISKFWPKFGNVEQNSYFVCKL